MPSRVKQALSETFVVIGGANVEGVVGLEAVRQFSFLDAGKVLLACRRVHGPN